MSQRRKVGRNSQRFKKQAGDTSVQFEGRTIEARVYINTDESLDEILARLQPAARGPRLRMCTIAMGILDQEQGRKLWELATRAAEDELSKSSEEN